MFLGAFKVIRPRSHTLLWPVTTNIDASLMTTPSKTRGEFISRNVIKSHCYQLHKQDTPGKWPISPPCPEHLVQVCSHIPAQLLLLPEIAPVPCNCNTHYKDQQRRTHEGYAQDAEIRRMRR